MPVGRVVGEFIIDDIVEGTPSEIWEKTKESAGIDQIDYLEYFYEKDKGYAISISNPILYDEPKLLKEISKNINVAPQSFRYIY